jgi:hypothetical protein
MLSALLAQTSIFLLELCAQRTEVKVEMISVKFNPQCSELLRMLEMSTKDIETTINDRHRGLCKHRT